MKKYLLFFIVLIPFLGYSQYTFYNQGALVYIQPKALVHVQGTITNANSSSAQLYNDGTLELEGDLNNVGSSNIFSYYTPSVNTAVKFVGNTTRQQITGNFSTSGNQQIYNMVVSQASASDTVEIENNVMINGSLVFGSQNYTTTYHPSSYWTDNGSTGLLKTFTGNSLNPATQFLFGVENTNIDAISGFPTLQRDLNPSTGYVLTSGLRDYTGYSTPSAYTGLQRSVTNTAPAANTYTYPVGTIAHGYNAMDLHLTNNVSQDIAAQFNDGTSNSNGYEGNLPEYCNVCGAPPNSQSYTPLNGGFNYLINSNPCSDNGGELWVILNQSTTNHGYWSLGSAGGNAYQYWVEMFMNNFSDNGSPAGLWRILKYTPTGTYTTGVAPDYQYYQDPTNQNWTSQVLSGIAATDDLIWYSAYASASGAASPCYANSANGVPGGIYTGAGHFASFREDINNALPVTLLDLTAEPINNQYIQVAWATSLEINNSGFELQRSTDGVNFTDVGWVAGHGNTTITENYTYNDNNVSPDVVYYYQLRQVDFNGNTKQSNVVSAQLVGSAFFTVGNFVPNPTSSSSKIIITTGAALTIDVKLYDVIGQQLTASKSYDLTVGENNIDFATQGFATGNYTAVISAGNKVYTKRLIVAKE